MKKRAKEDNPVHTEKGAKKTQKQRDQTDGAGQTSGWRAGPHCAKERGNKQRAKEINVGYKRNSAAKRDQGMTYNAQTKTDK